MSRFNGTLALNFVLSGLALAVVVSAGQAAPVGPLTTFTAGTPAKATEVNGNFTTIVNTVNAHDARLTTVETNKQNVVSGTCPAGNAIRAIAANGTVTCQNSGGTVGFASVNAIVGVPVPFFGPTPQTIGCLLCLASGTYATTGSGFLVAPIVLPHGATITSFSFSCFCNNATGSSAFLFRDDVNILANTSITTLSSTTIQTATTATIATTPANSAVVDNQNFSYFVFWSIDGTAGSNIMPVKATVAYTLP